MNPALILVFASIFAGSAAAQEVLAAEGAPGTDTVVVSEAAVIEIPPDVVVVVPELVVLDAAEVSLADFQWVARPIVVFADTPADPRFREQMDLLLARPEELIQRGVVVLTDTDPAAMSEVRLKLRPRGFMLTLLDKDGTINLRKPSPWNVREITRAIDKMPLRLEELRAIKDGG